MKTNRETTKSKRRFIGRVAISAKRDALESCLDRVLSAVETQHLAYAGVHVESESIVLWVSGLVAPEERAGLALIAEPFRIVVHEFYGQA